jgi:WS/DGAT/MGAT family acyltransferase
VEKLDPRTASYLQLETPHAPMHIGGLYLFEGRDADVAATYEALYAYTEARLDYWPRLRQRVVEVPLNLDCPSWIDDPDFYLGHHLRIRALTAHHDYAALLALARRFIARPLDRRRPLWDVTFVEGLEGVRGLGPGSFAIITRVHLAMAKDTVDRDSRIRLTTSKPTADLPPAPARLWQPEPLPTDAQLLARAWGRAISRPVDLAHLIGRGAMTAAQMVMAGTKGGTELPPLVFDAPPTPWNRPVRPPRMVDTAHIDLARVAAVCDAVGTVEHNDVILALIGGMLREALARDGTLPRQPLVAMSPVLVEKEQGGTAGQPLLTTLATDVDDPRERLQRIHQAGEQSRAYLDGMPVEKIAVHDPLSLAVQGVELGARLHLADRHRPIFNLVCVNLPVAAGERYLLGARLVDRAFMLPLMDGQGLSFSVIRCLDHLTMTAVWCPGPAPTLEGLQARVDRALEALESAAGRSAA